MDLSSGGVSRVALDDRIEAGAEQAFAFLERLVAAPSTVGREQEALEVVAAELADLGFAIERLPIRESVVDLPGAGVPLVPYAGRYDVVARRIGPHAGPSLLLNGHIDVVPADEPELWTSPPFAPDRRGGWLFGRGAGDMKAGFAMGVLALRAILDVAPDALAGPLTFLAAVEEECTGNGSLAAADAGVLADAVVLLEPTDLDLLVGGIGILWLEITVLGRAAHAYAAGSAVNAIEAALPLIHALRAMEDDLNVSHPDRRIESERPFTVNLGRLRGGDWASSVPAVAWLDVRVGFPRGWTPAEAEDYVRTWIGSASAADPWLADNPPTIVSSGFRAEGYDLPATAPLVRLLGGAHEDAHGTPARIVSLGSTTDARTYINGFGVPAICYGPRVERIHGIDEAVELASIVAGARTLARFLIDWYAREVVW